MTRNQIFTTLEFVNDSVRMVLGEYYNDKFYVYDVFESKSEGLLNGEIVDQELITKTIKQIRDSINTKHDILIEDVILVLPSHKLNILAFNSSSPVTGKNSLISEQDINEAYKVACKVRHNEDEKIISVIPIEYYLDTGEKMEFAPIKYRSSTFKTLFNVLLLPNETFDKYLGIVSSCNLKVSNYFLDSECLYYGAFEEGDINCAIISLNKFDTSVTVFKRGKLQTFYKTNRGSYDIEQELINEYHVKESDIYRVTYILGNSLIGESNKRAIYKNDGYGAYKYLNQYQVDQIISDKYKEIFEELLENASFDKNIYDVYLTGIASTIKGIDKYFSSISDCRSMTIWPSSLCLNRPDYVQTIGAIRLNYKKMLENKAVLENNVSVKETKESKFDKFILDENELE